MWNSTYSNELVFSLNEPFCRKSELNNVSKSISKRENDPEFFIKRIEFQIKEVLDHGLSYNTPEEWDKSFVILGGGSKMRTSKSILKRMEWSQFLYFVEEVSKNDQTFI